MPWATAYRLGLEWLWTTIGLSCLAGAAVLASRPEAFERLRSRLDTFGRSGFGRAAPALLFGGLIPLSMVLFKAAQFRCFELLFDSGIKVNLAWNAAHGYGLRSSVLCDQSFLAIHFSLVYALLAPLLLLWNSPLALVVAHAAIVATVPGCAFLLGKRFGGSAEGWLCGLLALGHPFFHAVAASPLNSGVFALPFFLWAACCWEYGLRGAAGLSVMLLLTTREQAPFHFLGLGAYFLLLARDKRSRAAALGLCAAAALVWWGELEVMRKMQGGLPPAWPIWSWFSGIGGSPRAILGTALSRPWEILLALVWPLEKPVRAAKVLATFALLPLAAGASLVPALAAWLPQLLADPGTAYHRLIGSQCAYIAGPLIWASARGLDRLARGVFRRRKRILAAGVLAVAGAGFLSTARFLLPPGLLPSRWREIGPRAAAAVDPGAKLWCDEFFLPHLGARRYVKALQSTRNVWFERGLFAPDCVLLSTYWIQRAEASHRDGILRYLSARGFREAYREEDLLVLVDPEFPAKQGAEPEWIALNADGP